MQRWVVSLFLILAVWSPVARAQAPVVPQGGVVNGASFIRASEPNGAVTSGAIVAIFGSNLSSGLAVAMSVPLSTTLNDTSVTFNGMSAPLFFVSPGQVNAQVPFEVVSGNATAVVRRGNLSSESQNVRVAEFSPGIFALNAQGTGAGAVLHANTPRVVSPTDPAAQGQFLSIFCTGLGALVTPVPSGGIATGASETRVRALVNVGGIPARVLYSGIAPGFVGLYQVNIEVPAGVQPGNEVPMQIIMTNVPSNIVTIAVR